MNNSSFPTSLLRTDLHAHTTASDGSLSPSQLVYLGKNIGLSSLAVTDHDTVAGLPEALAAGKDTGLKIIPGVEISTYEAGCDIHLLGLFINPENRELLSAIAAMKEKRRERNSRMIEKLQAAGFRISSEDFPESCGMITRTHIGFVLTERGYASSPMDAVRKYLIQGGIGYVPKARYSPKECADLIHAAGGVVIIAHINQISKEPETALRVARTLLRQKTADGLETLYCQYDDFWQNETEALAKEFGCLRSGGSDFHGSYKPGLELGSGYGDLCIPQIFADDMENFLQKM